MISKRNTLLSEKIFKLRTLLEKELGSARETTKILNGLSDDLTLGDLYVISALRALAFVSKNEKLKKELFNLIDEFRT